MFRICIFVKGDDYIRMTFALLQSINKLYGSNIKITILYVDVSTYLINEIKIKMPHAKLIKGETPSFNNRYTMSGKMQYWGDLIKDSVETNIALLDSDMILVKDISHVFDNEFDIGFTYKTEPDDDQSQWPINGGTLFIKKNDRTINFFDSWTKKTLDYITEDGAKYEALCKRWGAVDQAVLCETLDIVDRRRYRYPIYKQQTVFLGFPCKYYNELRKDPDADAHVYHFKHRWHHKLLKDEVPVSFGHKFETWKQHRWDWSEMENTCSISVIMGVHNQETYIREAISSILDQTFTDFEFIIIDDASTDNTCAIIDSFNDPRIKVITNVENIGLTKSLNRGLGVAQGTCIARLDADDRAHRKRFEIQYKYLRTHPNTALCGTRANIINKDGLVTSQSIAATPSDEFLKMLLWDNSLIHSSAMFRKRYIMEIGGYNEEYVRAQDYALWIEFYKKHRIVYLEDILIDWRSHKDGISVTNHTEQMATAELISLRFIRYTFPELNDVPDAMMCKFRKKYMGFFRSEKGPKEKQAILTEIQARLVNM